MRKFFIYLLVAVLSVFLMAGNALAAPKVILDGRTLNFDVPPMIEQGRTLVPLRAIFEAMGATLSWDHNSQTATATKNGTNVVLKIGSLQPTINGQIKTLDVPAKIVNGRTLAPLRFVGEAFGGSIEWDSATQTAYITSSSQTGQLPSTEKINVHFIDVGQADSIYIDLPNNNDILIDAGNKADGPTVVSYLKAQGVDDIELLIATHPHEDHIGGLPDVLSAFKVEKIIDSGYPASTDIYNSYASFAKAEGCPWDKDARQLFTWGNVALQVLTASETWDDVNDYSVVCRLDCGNIEFLFTGDAETPVENILKGELASEILKVGHHGSMSSTSSTFLSKVKPQVAVISVGAGNTYGHPNEETLTKLKNVGAKIYRTDLNGNIVITTDGQSYSVKTAKNPSVPNQEVERPVAPPLLPDTRMYVGSTKSDKYHLPTCRYAGVIALENEVWFKDAAMAKVAGYEPCGVCKP